MSITQTSEPTFSILLPTRNGMPYLQFAVESVLSQSAQNFELVVSDNHSVDGTAAYLATIVDPRCVVVRPNAPLSMIDHFEFLTSKAKGVWITTIGDDDGLLPFFFERVKELNLESIRSNAIVTRRAYYFWQGCEDIYGSSVLEYAPSAAQSKIYNKLSVFLCLSSVINYLHMPQLYTTGLVKRSYFEYIKRRSGGRFFYGISPDASSVVALALHTSWHVRLEECLFWTGTSPKSVGFSQGSTTSKARSIEFDEMNRGINVEANMRVLPNSVRQLFNSTVIFYAALLAHPNTSRFWSSRFARNFFIAGLIHQDETLLALLIDAYHEKFLSIELKPYRLCLTIVNWLYGRHLIKTGATKVETSLRSSDRAAYPTLREASKDVYRTWSEAKCRH